MGVRQSKHGLCHQFELVQESSFCYQVFANLDHIFLPEEISELVSLRYLDSSSTKIRQLPAGFQKLKMLIHLNLAGTRILESLDGISHLSSLRTLRLMGSRVWLDMSLMKELQLLEHLEYINIGISSRFVGEQWLYDFRVGRCIKDLVIQEHPEESVRVMNLAAMDDLHDLLILDCKMEEIKIENIGWSKSLTSPCLFSNLFRVEMIRCNGPKDLTWLLLAPNLSFLRVMDSKTIKEIISQEKSESVLEKGTHTILPFQNLEVLELRDLLELKSIYWNALPFQPLKKLVIMKCPKLRKLPLDSKSVSKVEDLVIEYNDPEWIESVEWEDEATRQRFMGRFWFSDRLLYPNFPLLLNEK